MGNVEALKDLYVAMGGSAADVENLVLNAEIIKALAEVVRLSGGILPAVTDADDGKVLTVVDGKWEAV